MRIGNAILPPDNVITRVYTTTAALVVKKIITVSWNKLRRFTSNLLFLNDFTLNNTLLKSY